VAHAWNSIWFESERCWKIIDVMHDPGTVHSESSAIASQYHCGTNDPAMVSAPQCSAGPACPRSAPCALHTEKQRVCTGGRTVPRLPRTEPVLSVAIAAMVAKTELKPATPPERGQLTSLREKHSQGNTLCKRHQKCGPASSAYLYCAACFQLRKAGGKGRASPRQQCSGTGGWHGRQATS